MALVISFAAFAIVLAALGVYGVISFTVARRTSELGIRLALGATPRSVALMVLRQGIVPVAAGLICGVACAAVAVRGVTSQLYGVNPIEPLVTVAIVTLLLGVGVLATLMPARRAMRTNPLTALRHD
jgi:ABC-type antimicrobial peptide transport system permease subunit